MLKDYYYLTKPGIIYGNLITTAAGFLFAYRNIAKVSWLLFIMTMIGTALVIASACVFNNYIDRKIDYKMHRTRKRALASGRIAPLHAVIYGVILGLLGIITLYLGVNLLTLYLGIIAFVIYVFIYGFSKRRTYHGTLIGSIAGSIPITAGYCAVTNSLNITSILLFLILTAWQMPHFYAIALAQQKDYQAAELPVLSVVKKMNNSKIQITLYIIVFIIANYLLYLFNKVTVIYNIIIISVGLYWFFYSLIGFKHSTLTLPWSKKMFKISLVVILINSLLLAVNNSLLK